MHLTWGSLVLAGCVVLLMSPGGHPPAMILVPPLLAVGVVGHLLLLGVAWLLGRGRARLAAAGIAARPWPLELIVLAVALVLGSLGSIAFLRVPPSADAAARAGGFASLHVAALGLLLLRRSAVRPLIAALAAGWGVVLALRLGDARLLELAIGIAIVAALLGLAVHVLRSRRIRSALV